MSVRVLCEVSLPQWVREVLNFGPKHPVKDKCNEILFLADFDKLLSELKFNRIDGEKPTKNQQLQRDKLHL